MIDKIVASFDFQRHWKQVIALQYPVYLSNAQYIYLLCTIQFAQFIRIDQRVFHVSVDLKCLSCICIIMTVGIHIELFLYVWAVCILFSVIGQQIDYDDFQLLYCCLIVVILLKKNQHLKIGLRLTYKQIANIFELFVEVTILHFTWNVFSIMKSILNIEVLVKFKNSPLCGRRGEFNPMLIHMSRKKDPYFKYKSSR